MTSQPLTGADGELRYGSEVIGKCSQWSLNINRGAEETTCLADYARTYVEGLIGALGTANLYYDPSKSTANRLLNSVLRPPGDKTELTFVLNRKGLGNGGGQLRCSGFLTNASPSVSVGAVQAVNVNFQVSGLIDGEF